MLGNGWEDLSGAGALGKSWDFGFPKQGVESTISETCHSGSQASALLCFVRV